MDLHLKNKVIIVTGGFKGIGKGITLRLAEEGAIPVVLNRSDGADDEFRQDIEQVTDSYDTYLIDLNNTDEIAPIVESVMKKYGHIDGVVNNAGRNDNLALETTSWRQFEESLHGNLTHYYELVHQRGPALKASKGSVVNIGSKTALTGQGKTSAYAAAKGAILGLTREWAAALAPARGRGALPRPGAARHADRHGVGQQGQGDLLPALAYQLGDRIRHQLRGSVGERPFMPAGHHFAVRVDHGGDGGCAVRLDADEGARVGAQRQCGLRAAPPVRTLLGHEPLRQGAAHDRVGRQLLDHAGVDQVAGDARQRALRQAEHLSERGARDGTVFRDRLRHAVHVLRPAEPMRKVVPQSTR